MLAAPLHGENVAPGVPSSSKTMLLSACGTSKKHLLIPRMEALLMAERERLRELLSEYSHATSMTGNGSWCHTLEFSLVRSVEDPRCKGQRLSSAGVEAGSGSHTEE